MIDQVFRQRAGYFFIRSFNDPSALKIQRAKIDLRDLTFSVMRGIKGNLLTAPYESGVRIGTDVGDIVGSNGFDTQQFTRFACFDAVRHQISVPVNGVSVTDHVFSIGWHIAMNVGIVFPVEIRHIVFDPLTRIHVDDLHTLFVSLDGACAKRSLWESHR